MGCVESIPSFRSKRLTEERGSFEVESPHRKVQWAKLLMSRSLIIDFRDSDNRTFYEESDFVAECLRYHNLFRNRHNAPPLKLNQELCHSAQTWANHLTHTGLFYHHNLPDIGENLFCRWNYTLDCEVTGKEAVEYWYHDIVNYNFELDPEVLHVNANAFTQMTWVATEEIGIGKARSRDGKYVVVANYLPAGNVPGQFQENVLPTVTRGEDNQGSPGYTNSTLQTLSDHNSGHDCELDDWDVSFLPSSFGASKLSDSYDFESVKSEL